MGGIMDFLEMEPQDSALIKVVGVGGGGGNAVNNMIKGALQGVTFITANTDMQALKRSGAEYKIQLGDSSRSEERRVGKECRSRWSPYH